MKTPTVETSANNPPPISVGRNESKSNFDPHELFLTNVRAVEELEAELASEELKLEDATDHALTALRPTVQRQLRHAFILCKLIFDGDLPQEFVDKYIDDSGVRRHGNDRIRHSRLLRAVVANARRNGAPISNRSPSRISAYASAINFALDLGWNAEQFEEHLKGARRNGENHGLEFLARRGMPRTASLQSRIAKALEALGLQEGECALVTFKKVAGIIEIATLQKRAATTSGNASAGQ